MTHQQVIKRKPSLIRRFLSKPSHQRRLILEALVIMPLVTTVIRFLPFRLLMRLIKAEVVPVNAPDDPHKQEREIQDEELIEAVARTVRSLSRRVPWESKCLVQASVARIMLNRRGIPSTLYLGVNQHELQNLQPHAWLRVGDRIVLGDHELDRYVTVSRLE